MAAPPRTTDVISVERLSAGYGDRLILEDVSFRLGERQTLAVVGASGCGKSTLLRCLIGLLPPLTGTIRVLGEDITALERRDLDQLRRKFGVAFQGSALLNSLSIADNVALPLREHTRLDEATIGIMTRLKLEQVGLGGAGDKLPSQLSGGMRKRAGIARALALDPALLFLDEPTAGLDPIGAAAFDQLILSLQRALGLTVFLITHDLDTLYTICNRIAVLADKRVLVNAPISEVEKFDHPWVQEYFHGPRGRAAQSAQEKL